MIGDVEFNSSCFYKYFSLDWDAFAAMVQDHQKTGANVQNVAKGIGMESIPLATAATMVPAVFYCWGRAFSIVRRFDT